MLAFMNIPFFKSWCVTCVIYVALFALHCPTIWSPHALTFFKKPRLVHELFWRQNWERSMHFPSILISISFVFLQIISKGSCGKCFVQFAFGSRMFNTFAIDTHEPSIVRFALRFNMLVVWLTLLKILIQQRCLFEFLSMRTSFWETAANLEMWLARFCSVPCVYLRNLPIRVYTRLKNVNETDQWASLFWGWFTNGFWVYLSLL